MSKTLYTAMGADLPKAFADQTHHRGYGAYELAKCVVAGLKQQGVPLARSVRDDFPAFDPAKPDPFEKYAVPASAPGSGGPPQAN
jgi:hypothetical protein